MVSGRFLSRTIALLRYHRPSQFAWRLVRVAQRHIRRRLPERLVFSTGGQPARWKPQAKSSFTSIARHRLGLWPGRHCPVSEIVSGRFQFLNQLRDLNLSLNSTRATIDWNPDAPRLWRFHLQSHEFLLEVAEEAGAQAAYGIVSSWLSDPRNQSPTRDPDAWHPFCISRRLPVWMSLAATYDVPQEIDEVFWRSVTDQVQWLRRNCEWDLGGNHLLENLTALYLAVTFLDIDATSDRVSIESQLAEQLRQQILPSGEHFERTPTYHALMIVCVLQCAEAAIFAQSTFSERIVGVLSEMVQFAKWIRQPDGKFPLLSDSAHDETPSLDRLFAWSETLSTSVATCDPAVDYWAGQSDSGNRILFDIGPLACDHLPAHGHADLLQITATLGGRDAIVDTGNFEYEPGEMRTRCRGTSAHNVLQLGVMEQCDTWSSFRMGRRGHIVWKKCGAGDGYRWCAAAHDGFDCTVGRIVVDTGSAWTIIDWFDGSSNQLVANSRLHWHPDWKLIFDESENVILAANSTCRTEPYSVRLLGNSVRASIRDSVYCPAFGEQIENQVIVASMNGACSGWLGFHLSLSDAGAKSLPLVQYDKGSMRLDLHDGTRIEIA